MGELTGDPHILIVAIGTQTLVALFAVFPAQRIRIKTQRTRAALSRHAGNSQVLWVGKADR